MEKIWRIAIGQINCTVGDLNGNCLKMKEYIERSHEAGADILIFPELAITGYPPEDLLLKDRFIQDNLKSLGALALHVPDMTVITGFVDRRGSDIYNSAAVMYHKEIKGVYHKTLLPNYGVFDEKRYFSSGSRPDVYSLGDICFGVSICEDIWCEDGPTRIQASMGARLVLNINASPYHAGKIREREGMVISRARSNNLFIFYANMVGGQDELVFDGQSLAADADGNVVARGLAFQEELLFVDIPDASFSGTKHGVDEAAMRHGGGNTIIIAKAAPARHKKTIVHRETVHLEPVAEVYGALLLGLKDYVMKNGFKKVTLGLSGGIDSALVAALAVDVLGKDNVVGVFMPSRYTSEESYIDANELARLLDVRVIDIPIDRVYEEYLSLFKSHFEGIGADVTEENIQARIRGNILMAFSNKFGWLVLTTGNKSEMSVGYATLYGDMAGGFAVIKDVPKTLVYALSVYRNSLGQVIPERILAKAPTAELRPDQKDVDSLPPYEELDPVLKAYVEEDKHGEEITASGASGEVVEKVLRMVDYSEYKRRQSPPGIKITPKAFGRDRRMPITNKYRG